MSRFHREKMKTLQIGLDGVTGARAQIKLLYKGRARNKALQRPQNSTEKRPPGSVHVRTGNVHLAGFNKMPHINA